MSTERSKAIRAGAAYTVLILGALVTVAPLVLSALTAVKTPRQFASESPLAAPHPATLDNFATVLAQGLGRAVAVTALMTVCITGGQLLASIMAAHVFARIEFPGRDALFWTYLGTMMVPSAVTLVPLYLMFAKLGWLNTFWALVLPYLFGSPYAIFLLRQYFRAIPGEIIDAARVDGAGTLDILVSVVVPMSRPILATLTVITVVSQWNNFMWPLVAASGPKWQVLTVATANMQTQYDARWTLIMAATTLAIAPLVVLFVVFQRQVLRSVAVTGLK
ncbi:carbohydrate ABC transporter permease [Nocardia seriolae]|uniref:ABC transporter permease protein YesQ n=1 Tax=Nocardia seriolae TaxID=37332 RepID=A0A0B8NHM9_9NOCA|nr:carbohydrate ABC transporter permease [Nocardia seriolae]APA94628.1 putative ABC transporter permease protein YesQ [Nocardia seriolae]MTJ66950.1 ABC transporter permease subunit [Nocardia seriolae]MTJ72775.1 ABC transporter permease subunit [Nocardia seriolae]MTJ84931.1 ABC transporter permease subunit [Nocardia seriolae]MTK28927.1 ABC transporter permease subunit [Nocardia seriolae]